jgi:hypothetical protein
LQLRKVAQIDRRVKTASLPINDLYNSNAISAQIRANYQIAETVTIQIKANWPTSKIATGWGRRDKKTRDHFAAPKYIERLKILSVLKPLLAD